MIWGIQWDETLKWLIDTGEKTYAKIASNSTSWGSCYDNSFTCYTNTSKSTATKVLHSYTIIPSGAYEGANANNVYDLAGNVYDWTLESSSSGTGYGRYYRGGCYASRNNDFSVASREDYYPSEGSNFGLRCSLFIK